MANHPDIPLKLRLPLLIDTENARDPRHGQPSFEPCGVPCSSSQVRATEAVALGLDDVSATRAEE